MHRLCDGLNEGRGPLRRELIASRELGEIAAGNEIHREVLLPFVLTDFVDGDDIRVLKIGRSFRLGEIAVEPRASPIRPRGSF